MGRREDVWSQLYGLQPATNYWNDYQNPFSYNDVSSNLSTIFGNEKADINRNTNSDIASQQQNAAQSMASRGITGGSILTDTQNKIASGINRQKYNALSQLGTSQAQDTMNLEELFNQLGFQQNQAKQNQANTIFGQQSNKVNALAGYLNDWEKMDLQHDQNSNALLSLAQLLKTPTGKGTNVFSSLIDLI